MANLVIAEGAHESRILGTDQARISIHSTMERQIMMYSQGRACQGCAPHLFHELQPRENASFIVRTSKAFGTYLKIGDACGPFEDFDDQGEYAIEVSQSENGEDNCELKVLYQPSNSYLPIVYAVCFYLCLAAIYFIVNFIVRKCKKFSDPTNQPNNIILHKFTAMGDQSEVSDDKEDENSNGSKSGRRLMSLDVFRGLTMAICIFAINGAGGYYFFDHALWDGLYLADFVFPWFMWIMGAGVAFAINSQLRRQIGRGKILWNVVRRSLWLFLFGLMLNTIGGHNDLEKLRVPGVLQRFAIAYLVVGTFSTIFSDAQNSALERWWDIGNNCTGRLKFIAEWLLYLGVLACHVYVTFYFEVPGCPRGYLGPGGDHKGGKFRNCTGGAAGYIDNLVLSNRHIYQNPTIKILYRSGAFDPEGLLGCLTTIFMVFTGTKAGRIILNHRSDVIRILWCIFWFLITGTATLILCGASLEDEGIIPINKNLWSISFILAISSSAFFFITLFYLLVDVKHIWSGSPFLQPGKNSLLLYLGASILSGLFPFNWKMEDNHAMKTFNALWQATIWVIISIHLHRKKLYFTL